ncbi:hypothetical protein RUM44_009097 [Polyplax serrata]|uniref:Uncharacterized protein n=1 Tax=Polyplax serrata TaxID=468196 RepID=A0ABR1ARR7_POLSC
MTKTQREKAFAEALKEYRDMNEDQKIREKPWQRYRLWGMKKKPVWSMGMSLGWLWGFSLGVGVEKPEQKGGKMLKSGRTGAESPATLKRKEFLESMSQGVPADTVMNLRPA